MEAIMNPLLSIESCLQHWASNIHEQASCLWASRYLVFPFESNLEPIDMGTTKLRNCSMKAMDIVVSFAQGLNKLLGYSPEAAEWIEKDPVVYSLSMALYLLLRKVLMIFTRGNFSTND